MTGAPKPQLLMGCVLAPLGYYLQNCAWKDIFKKSDSWRTSTDPKNPTWGTDWSTAMTVDADGYPTSIPQNSKYAHVVTGHQLYTGEYVLLWDGTGDVNVQGFSYNVTSANRKTFSVTKSSNTFFNVMISSSSATDHVRNIRLLIPGSEATYKTQPLNPDFIARMANVGIVRYMDWGATNNSAHKSWSDRVTEFALQGTSGDGSSGGLGGTSYEMMCDTSNALNAHMWVCVPHQVDDNYVTQMATLIKSRLNSNLHCYIEYSNELWNGQFQQTTWTETQGKNANLLNVGYAPGQTWCAGINYSARRAAQIWKIFTTVFGGTSRIVRVMASQNGGVGITDAWIVALNNSTINPLSTDPDARPDALAVAPYVGASGVQSTDTVASVVAKMTANLSSGDVFGGTALHKQRADANGLRLIAYEGGQTLYTPSGNNANTLLAQVNRSPDIDALYRAYFANWFSITQDVFCHFNDCFNDDTSGGNFWGLIQKQNEQPASLGKAKAFEDVAASFAGTVVPPVTQSAPVFTVTGSQVTPSHAFSGSIISLNGTNMAGVVGVSFNVSPAIIVTPVSTTSTSVNISVPASLPSGSVCSLSVSDGVNPSVTSTDKFKLDTPIVVLPVPTLSVAGSQISPMHALTGSIITISGSALDLVTRVTFNASQPVTVGVKTVTTSAVTAVVPQLPANTKCTITLTMTNSSSLTTIDLFTLDAPVAPPAPSPILSTDWKNGYKNGFAFGVNQGSNSALSASSGTTGTTTDYGDGYKQGYGHGYLFGYQKTH